MVQGKRGPKGRHEHTKSVAPAIICLYQQGKSTSQIAQQVGLSQVTVRRVLRDAGIDLLSRRNAGQGKLFSAEPAPDSAAETVAEQRGGDGQERPQASQTEDAVAMGQDATEEAEGTESTCDFREADRSPTSPSRGGEIEPTGGVCVATLVRAANPAPATPRDNRCVEAKDAIDHPAMESTSSSCFERPVSEAKKTSAG